MPTVRDLLGRKRARGAQMDVVSIGPDVTVLEAARLMTARGIGGLVVLEDARLAGIFTERDILRRVVTAERDPATTRVREVMTSPVLTVDPSVKVRACRATFTERRIRHLPIVEGDEVVGMITSGDVIAYEAEEARTAAEHLESYVYYSR
jgi:CBS domain-containing protein